MFWKNFFSYLQLPCDNPNSPTVPPLLFRNFRWRWFQLPMNSSSQLALGDFRHVWLQCFFWAENASPPKKRRTVRGDGTKQHWKDMVNKARMDPNNRLKQSEGKKRLGTRYTAATSPKCGFFSMVFQFNNSKVQPTDIWHSSLNGPSHPPNLEKKNELVVEPTQLKNMIVKLDHFPKDRGENLEKKWNHHPEKLLYFPPTLTPLHRTLPHIYPGRRWVFNHPGREHTAGDSSTAFSNWDEMPVKIPCGHKEMPYFKRSNWATFYPSSHNRGSGKWFPPTVVSSTIRSFSTSMIMGERVRLIMFIYSVRIDFIDGRLYTRNIRKPACHHKTPWLWHRWWRMPKIIVPKPIVQWWWKVVETVRCRVEKHQLWITTSYHLRKVLPIFLPGSPPNPLNASVEGNFCDVFFPPQPVAAMPRWLSSAPRGSRESCLVLVVRNPWIERATFNRAFWFQVTVHPLITTDLSGWSSRNPESATGPLRTDIHHITNTHVNLRCVTRFASVWINNLFISPDSTLLRKEISNGTCPSFPTIHQNDAFFVAIFYELLKGQLCNARMILSYTPWKFNSSPLKISHPKRKAIFLSHHFSGAMSC